MLSTVHEKCSPQGVLRLCLLRAGLASAAPGAGEAMTELLRRSPTTTTRIGQECLRLLAGLMRTCPEWAPTTPQLRFLVTWALSDVEEAAAHVAAFTLLRGVIKRRLVLPEVYDVMGKVQDLMIRSQVRQRLPSALSLVLRTVQGCFSSWCSVSQSSGRRRASCL